MFKSGDRVTLNGDRHFPELPQPSTNLEVIGVQIRDGEQWVLMNTEPYITWFPSKFFHKYELPNVLVGAYLVKVEANFKSNTILYDEFTNWIIKETDILLNDGVQIIELGRYKFKAYIRVAELEEFNNWFLQKGLI